jgi:hypothetical protein
MELFRIRAKNGLHALANRYPSFRRPFDRFRDATRPLRVYLKERLGVNLTDAA